MQDLLVKGKQVILLAAIDKLNICDFSISLKKNEFYQRQVTFFVKCRSMHILFLERLKICY